jgi:predicted 2-oxoglutarate/Fe(II)-dependent dioxygenase YbiX
VRSVQNAVHCGIVFDRIVQSLFIFLSKEITKQMRGISRNSDCPCGSGIQYQNCCGDADKLLWNEQANGRIQGSFSDPELAKFVSNEPVCELNGTTYPPGILVRQLGSDYELQEICDAIIATANARVANVINETKEKRIQSNRVTGIVDPGAMESRIIELVRKAFACELEPFYNCKLRSLETPQVLRYVKGSHFKPHSDSDIIDFESKRWKKAQDRDYSLLIYLDQDFEGGELIFPNFDFTLHPEAGMLVCFPADFRYLHGAMPVISGVRHAIVSWCAIQRKP